MVSRHQLTSGPVSIRMRRTSSSGNLKRDEFGSAQLREHDQAVWPFLRKRRAAGLEGARVFLIKPFRKVAMAQSVVTFR